MKSQYAFLEIRKFSQLLLRRQTIFIKTGIFLTTNKI